MTKSRAHELAEEHADNLANHIWNFTPHQALKTTFLAGMKAMLDEAEKMAYPSEVDSDGEAASDLEWVKLSDLRKLMGQDG